VELETVRMGSSTSKPETKVFTPATPVDFSASFLSQLENSSEVCVEESLGSLAT